MIRDTIDASQAVGQSVVRLDMPALRRLLGMTSTCGVVRFRLSTRHFFRMISFFGWLAEKVSGKDNATLVFSDTLTSHPDWCLHGEAYSKWPEQVTIATNGVMFKRFVSALSTYTLHLYAVTPYSIENEGDSEPELAAASLLKRPQG